MRIKGSASLIGLIYFAIGIFIAWTHHYLTVSFLKALLSVILVVFLWWLVLLGVNLHIH